MVVDPTCSSELSHEFGHPLPWDVAPAPIAYRRDDDESARSELQSNSAQRPLARDEEAPTTVPVQVHDEWPLGGNHSVSGLPVRGLKLQGKVQPELVVVSVRAHEGALLLVPPLQARAARSKVQKPQPTLRDDLVRFDALQAAIANLHAISELVMVDIIDSAHFAVEGSGLRQPMQCDDGAFGQRPDKARLQPQDRPREGVR
mmetsp:Transcript_72333/g.182440  ORF Transcript_72333/g.182440 Transcript_72333/m.182440 type:complete len:202 (-) Transcript_72333:570-1175(-)